MKNLTLNVCVAISLICLAISGVQSYKVIKHDLHVQDMQSKCIAKKISLGIERSDIEKLRPFESSEVTRFCRVIR